MRALFLRLECIVTLPVAAAQTVRRVIICFYISVLLLCINADEHEYNIYTKVKNCHHTLTLYFVEKFNFLNAKCFYTAICGRRARRDGSKRLRRARLHWRVGKSQETRALEDNTHDVATAIINRGDTIESVCHIVWEGQRQRRTTPSIYSSLLESSSPNCRQVLHRHTRVCVILIHFLSFFSDVYLQFNQPCTRAPWSGKVREMRHL